MSAPLSMWVPRPVWRSLWDCRHPPRVNATPSAAFRSVSIGRHPGLDLGSPEALKSWNAAQDRGDAKWDVRSRSVRSEERRVGQECVSTCRSDRSTSHKKKKKK